MWGVRHSCKGRGRALDVGHVGRVLMGWRAASMVIWLLGEARGLSGWAGLQTYVQLIMSKLSNWRPCSSQLKTGGRGSRAGARVSPLATSDRGRPPPNRPLPCHLFAPRPCFDPHLTLSSPRRAPGPLSPFKPRRFLTFFYGFPPDKFWALHNGGVVSSRHRRLETHSLVTGERREDTAASAHSVRGS